MNNNHTGSSILLLSLVLALCGHDTTAQWNEEEAPTTGILWNVRFLNDQIGWLKGNDHHDSSDSAYVFKTTNGGASWEISDTWIGTSYGALCVIDEMTVLSTRAVSGIDQDDLRRTTDGGLTWSTVDSIRGFYEDIEFVNSAHGFAVGGNGCYPCGGFVRRTTDGGAT